MGISDVDALTSWWVIIRTGYSRGTRVVKGAGFRSQCVVLRRFKSCPLHQPNFFYFVALKSNLIVNKISRGTRVVKGAAFRSLCVVLRRFKSCPLHHHLILILLERIFDIPLFFQPTAL